MDIFSRKSDHNSSFDENSLCYHIEGFINCSYLNSAIDVGNKLKQSKVNSKDRNISTANVNVSVHEKEKWSDRVKYLQSVRSHFVKFHYYSFQHYVNYHYSNLLIENLELK
ncbi:hypothetical protein F8M41_026500 [Gigaspora margarita]|uniref:Uncharacterized protein n=1 Tax=Gigaspora margarita TaxID=4874 RepID=A0A8H4AZN1_GIGMA|nr:hypothetical protein F8M41_026500 [Gigaspora margarita]